MHNNLGTEHHIFSTIKFLVTVGLFSNVKREQNLTKMLALLIMHGCQMVFWRAHGKKGRNGMVNFARFLFLEMMFWDVQLL